MTSQDMPIQLHTFATELSLSQFSPEVAGKIFGYSVFLGALSFIQRPKYVGKKNIANTETTDIYSQLRRQVSEFRGISVDESNAKLRNLETLISKEFAKQIPIPFNVKDDRKKYGSVIEHADYFMKNVPNPLDAIRVAGKQMYETAKSREFKTHKSAIMNDREFIMQTLRQYK